MTLEHTRPTPNRDTELAQADGGRGAVPEANETPIEEVLAEMVATSSPLVRGNRELLTRGIRKRRSSPIHGYVGLNGNFKTWAMVRDCLPSIALGRRILSTVAILDPQTGNPHPLYVPFQSWSQLATFEHGDILLDEITGIMDSREQGMPKAVRRLMPQMRRRDCRIAWTGIDFDNSDRRLRQLSQAVTKCKGHMGDWAAVRRAQKLNPETSSLWAPNRLAYLTTYDASSLMASDDTKQLNFELGRNANQKAQRARVLVRELAWAPTSLAFKCYNTLDAVLAVDNSCIHGLEVPKPGLCKDPQCLADHAAGLGRRVLDTHGLDHDVDGLFGLSGE
jgi:hypothetical protein